MSKKLNEEKKIKLAEGIVDTIWNLISKGRHQMIRRKLKKDKDILKAVDDINASRERLQKIMQKKLGVQGVNKAVTVDDLIDKSPRR